MATKEILLSISTDHKQIKIKLIIAFKNFTFGVMNMEIEEFTLTMIIKELLIHIHYYIQFKRMQEF